MAFYTSSAQETDNNLSGDSERTSTRHMWKRKEAKVTMLNIHTERVGLSIGQEATRNDQSMGDIVEDISLRRNL